MALDVLAMQSFVVERLPVRRRWLIGETPLDFDFSVASSGLRPPGADEHLEGLEDWRGLLVFGKADYADGGGSSSWICIDSKSGAVCGVDLDREPPKYALNSTLEQFVRTFECLDSHISTDGNLSSSLADRVERIDPDAYQGSEWRLFVEHLTGGN